MDAQNGNGSNLEKVLTVGPADKLLILRVDEGSQQITVAGAGAIKEEDIIDILYVALAQAINTLKAKVPKSNIISLPPGTRLKG